MCGETRVQLISETTDCDYKAAVESSKPLFESKQEAFWVTLWNMNHETEGTSGTQVSTQVSTQVKLVVEALGDRELSAPELMGIMGFSERSTFRKNYLKPALDSGAIERTIPDKPNSRNQKYRRAR